MNIFFNFIKLLAILIVTSNTKNVYHCYFNQSAEKRLKYVMVVPKYLYFCQCQCNVGTGHSYCTIII